MLDGGPVVSVSGSKMKFLGNMHFTRESKSLARPMEGSAVMRKMDRDLEKTLLFNEKLRRAAEELEAFAEKATEDAAKAAGAAEEEGPE